MKSFVKSYGKKAISCFLCLIIMLSACIIPASASALPFTDVPETAWYYEAVLYVYNLGLMAGVTPTKFAPSSYITRGDCVIGMARLAEQLGDTISDSYDHPFTDVSEDAYYAKYVGWAWANGVVNGVTPTTFKPNANLTREQMAVLITNFCKHMNIQLRPIRSITFRDIDQASSWALSAIQTCGNAGVFGGEDGADWLGVDPIFRPRANTTRSQVAAAIYNLVSIQIS